MSISLMHNVSSKAIRMANPHVSEILMENDLLLLPIGTKKEALSTDSSFEHLQSLPRESGDDKDTGAIIISSVAEETKESISIQRAKSYRDKASELHPICVEHTNQTLAEKNIHEIYNDMQSRFEAINREFQERKAKQEQKNQNIVEFYKSNVCDANEQLSPVKKEKLACVVEDPNEVPVKAEVYYCTSEGKVYGELTVTKHRVFFEPADTLENNYLLKQVEHKKRSLAWFFTGAGKQTDVPHLTQLKRFEACLDIGDVISC